MSYDEWLEAPYMRQDDPIEDEGIAILESAMKYLKPRADADADEQETGEFEAYSILQDCARHCMESYDCKFCGTFTGHRNSYCSRNCRVADEEGY